MKFLLGLSIIAVVIILLIFVQKDHLPWQFSKEYWFSTQTSEQICAGHCKDLVALVRCHAMDDAGAPWYYQPQLKKGQKHLAIYRECYGGGIYEQGYAKNRESIFTCPEGGLYHLGLGYCYCSTHGVYVDSKDDTSFVKSNSSDSGMIKTGSFFFFYWGKSSIAVETDSEFCQTIQLSSSLASYCLGRSGNLQFKLCRENGKIYYLWGNAKGNESNIIDITLHPSREKLIEVMKPFIETRFFHRMNYIREGKN